MRSQRQDRVAARTHESRTHRIELDDQLEPRLTPDRPRGRTDQWRRRYEVYLAEIFTVLGLDLDTPMGGWEGDGDGDAMAMLAPLIACAERIEGDAAWLGA